MNEFPLTPEAAGALARRSSLTVLLFVGVFGIMLFLPVLNSRGLVDDRNGMIAAALVIIPFVVIFMIVFPIMTARSARSTRYILQNDRLVRARGKRTDRAILFATVDHAERDAGGEMILRGIDGRVLIDIPDGIENGEALRAEIGRRFSVMPRIYMSLAEKYPTLFGVGFGAIFLVALLARTPAIAIPTGIAAVILLVRGAWSVSNDPAVARPRFPYLRVTLVTLAIGAKIYWMIS